MWKYKSYSTTYPQVIHTLGITLCKLTILLLQFTGYEKTDENRRQVYLSDSFHPFFHIGRMPDASCPAEPGKKIPVKSNWQSNLIVKFCLTKN